MKYITFIIPFIFLISVGFSQTLTYVISAENSPIGNLVAKKNG